ncbi:MAG: TVP38/TMEM64 family protein [Polyangia bacterium]
MTRIVLALLAIGVIVLAFVLLPVGRWSLALVDWIRGAGVLGVVVFSLAYIVGTAAMLPGAALTLGAGFAYGPLWGTLLVSPVSVVAATVSFVLARSVARGWVSGTLSRDPRFTALDAAIGERGFGIVLLLRLSPLLPFNLLNYALGITRVRLRDYVLASALGMLPGTVLYVYLGSLVTSASELVSGHRPAGGPWGRVIYWGGLAATLVVTVVVSHMAKQALSSRLDAAKAPPTQSPQP